MKVNVRLVPVHHGEPTVVTYECDDVRTEPGWLLIRKLPMEGNRFVPSTYRTVVGIPSARVLQYEVVG